MKLEKSNPWLWFAIYIIIIIFFGWIFSLFPTYYFNKEIEGYDYIYFSAVTITTLGYGDIYPNDDWVKLIANIESIIGLLLIGLFLNSIWHKFTIELEEKQKARQERFEKKKNKQTLLSIWDYVGTILDEYIKVVKEATGQEEVIVKISGNYKFSSLTSLFEPSNSLLRGDFKKEKFKWFYEIESELVSELRELTKNPIFIDEKIIYDHLIDLLRLVKQTDISNFLYNFENMKAGDDHIFNILKTMISEHESTPDINKFKSNIITPIIIFDIGLREKISLIHRLEKEINDLKAKD